MDSITRRDVLDVIERLRSDGRLAPKTIRNVYGTLRTLFRDALLSVATQYRDEPLKTKTPRIVPVHPVLAELLTAWKCSGFKQFFLRDPRPEDFIVPSRRRNAE